MSHITKNKNLSINYGLIIKVEIDTDIVLWAIWYHLNLLNIPAKKINKTMINKFIKEQVASFGTCHDTLMGSHVYEVEDVPAEEYKKIENIFERIFNL